ncbi:MAG: hypothetical protein PUJ11_07990 [Eubacteriaceae bacterium]|nr:hypothetical protein [Eubacteriaceae bacterium]
MNKNELIKRYMLFIIGLFICAVGVAITKRGELGVSPVSSVANILCIKYDFLSLGNWLIIWNCILILGQIVILGLGVYLSVSANVIMNSGEAFVKAVSDKTHFEFGNVKIGFDISCVIIAVLLSLVFFRGQIYGTREGTLIAALFTGIVVKFCKRHLKIDMKLLEC